MHSYAEKDSTTRTDSSREDELSEQPDIAESRWFDQAERIGRNGEWNFELADSMPFLISELPCWKIGGLALHVRIGQHHEFFGATGPSANEISIEVEGSHYWAVINGVSVWVSPDGNCFFNAIWKSLQACGDMDAVRRIFRGNVPANEREASDYFRREIRRYALDHPELEAILLGDVERPADPWRAPRCPPGLRQPDAQPECKSSKVGDVAGSAIRIRLKNNRYSPVVNGKALPAHSLIRNRVPVVETSGVPGDLDETDIDEFFDASDTAEWLVQAGRPAVHAAGPEGGRLTPDNSQTPMSGVNLRSILYKRPTLRASEIPRARKTVRWNASLVESIPIPQTGQSEWQRVLFSVGYQVSGWLAYSELRTFGYWALGKISPLASVATSAGMSLYNLVMAWKQGDVPAGLIQALLVLPYQLLSPQSLLFAIAETTKQYIDDTLGLTDPDSLSDDERFQRDTLYLCAGLVALVSYYGFFVPRKEVYSKISGLLGIRARRRNLLLHHNRRRLRTYLGGRGKCPPKAVRFRNAMKPRGSAQGHYAKLPPKGFLLRNDARPLRTFVSGRARAKFTPDEFRFRPKARPSRISLEQRAKSPLDRIFQQHVVAAVRTVLAERTVFPPNGFLVANNMAAPQTPLGRKLAGMVRVPQYAVQGYAALQKVVRARPHYDFHPGTEDLLAERMKLSPQEKATQKQERWERRNAARAARVRSNTTSLTSSDTGLKMQAAPTMVVAMPGEGNGLVVGYKRENLTSNAVPGGVCTGVTAHAFFAADKYTSAIARNPELPRDPEALTATTRSPGVKSGGYMSVPMAVATGTAAIVVGNAAFSSASGDAVAHTVENAALLIDENAAVAATVGGMRPGLWRRPFVIAPLVFAALGLMGAVLYRLYLWVMALWHVDGNNPGLPTEFHGENATSAVSADVEATMPGVTGHTAMHGTREGASSFTLAVTQGDVDSRTEANVTDAPLSDGPATHRQNTTIQQPTDEAYLRIDTTSRRSEAATDTTTQPPSTSGSTQTVAALNEATPHGTLPQSEAEAEIVSRSTVTAGDGTSPATDHIAPL